MPALLTSTSMSSAYSASVEIALTSVRPTEMNLARNRPRSCCSLAQIRSVCLDKLMRLPVCHLFSEPGDLVEEIS
jgi:hypothetical protein